MRRIFTVVMLLITATVVNAQDAQNPWHLIAFENEEEVAFYNVEVITGIEVTSQSVKIVLDNGKEFIHPSTTTKFGFDPRQEGTATTNESITVPQWNVRYSSGRLHFSETVNRIAVYTVSGALLAGFTGNYTEVSVDLPSGIYIVQAGGKSTKLAVGTNGNGGMVAQSDVETQATTYSPAPIILCSSNEIKIYWNITASNSTMSVEIPNVEKFYFTADISVVLTMKNGNTIELFDYHGVGFVSEPTLTVNSEIDWNLTLSYGGATYDADGYEIVAIVYNDKGIKFFSVAENNAYIRYSWEQIKADWKTLSAGKEFKLTLRNLGWAIYDTYPAVVFYNPRNVGTYPMHWTFENILIGGLGPGDANQILWDYNNNTPIINTMFTQNVDGSVTVSYTNRGHVQRTITAKEW